MAKPGWLYLLASHLAVMCRCSLPTCTGLRSCTPPSRVKSLKPACIWIFLNILFLCLDIDMASKAQLELFNKYFDQLAAQRGCFSVQDKLELQRELRKSAVEQGTVPISLTQLARVDVSDPRLQAVLNGQEVSLGGVMVGAEKGTARQ